MEPYWRINDRDFITNYFVHDLGSYSITKNRLSQRGVVEQGTSQSKFADSSATWRERLASIDQYNGCFSFVTRWKLSVTAMDGEVDAETLFSIKFPFKHTTSGKLDIDDDQRNFAVIGETIDLIIIAQYKGDGAKDGNLSRWKRRVESMSTSVAVSSADGDRAGLDPAGGGGPSPDPSTRREELVCNPFASYKKHGKKKKRRWQVWDGETLYCQVVAALDGISTRCRLCEIHVALWSPQLMDSSPVLNQITHQDHPLQPAEDDIDDLMGGAAFVRQIVTRQLPVLSPPEVRCRHASIGGSHHIFITVQNQYRDNLCVESLSVLPNANEGLLPTHYHPALGPLASDSTSDESDDSTAGDLDGNSFMKVETPRGHDLPTTLVTHEAQTFMVTLRVIDSADLNDAQDMHLFAALTWRKANRGDQGQQIVTHYRLPSITVRKPGLVITATPDATAGPNKSFNVQYTITNNLQDFLSLKLVWNPEKALSDPRIHQRENYKQAVENVLKSVICHQPSCHLGSCKQGSTITVPIGFQVLNNGVFELGQHLKLKLQYAVTSMVPPGGGHQRRGSITSTHSLPVDPRPHAALNPPNRSASMCPLAPDDGPVGVRRCSVASAKSISSAPTPTENNSPVHTTKTGSYGNLIDNHHRGMRIQTAPSSATVSPSNRSPVQMASPANGRPGPITSGVITPQQVLKRNCQVYITSQS